MDLYCTRPGCPKPINPVPDLDDAETLKRASQKYCTTCGMPLILADRYLPQALLGQGGFGAAFLACDRYSPRLRPCVVKQFQPSANLTPTQLQTTQALFEREAETLEDLGNPHPQIPDLYAYFELSLPRSAPGQSDRFFYLAQEWIDGKTLEEELQTSGVFTTEAVLEVLQAVLKILQFVHEHGVIHRDIKPSNIMRDRRGVIYLLDFGAVRQATKGATKSTGIYSEGFAPPEQMQGAAVFPSTDLYALAVTCVMLLTNHPPSELYDSYTGRWNWHSPAIAVDPSVAAILDRMLLATPSDRYQSATAVLQALQHLGPRSSLPASALAPSPPPPAPPTQLPPPPAHTSLQTTRPAIAPFSTLELLANAGFTGFQAGLLGLGLISVLGTSLVSGGFWLLLLLGLIMAQARRLIERVDLVLIAATSLGIMLVVPALRQGVPALVGRNVLLTVLALAIFTGLIAIAATTLFRLLYQLLARRP